MSFGDHSADDSSILVLGDVLTPEFKQLNLEICRQIHLNQSFNTQPSICLVILPGYRVLTGAYLKNKGGIWGYLGWAACRAICILGLTDELAHFTDLHGGHANVPCLYYLS